MLIRIVKMTFREETINEFISVFNASKNKIRRFEGCLHLELLRDINNPCVFFTYSYWESETHLNTYRHSDLFQSVWSNTKLFFSEKPEAWSVEQKYNVN